MISALTLVRGRQDHLANLMRGLAMQAARPGELVIGVMGDAALEGLPAMPFPVRQVLVPGEPVPLAAARNAVARAARGDLLVFLDVDCIPAPGCLADYARHHAAAPGILMGEVMYLPKGAQDGGLDFDAFARVAVRHSDRRAGPAEGVDPCLDYRCFWSLNFAIGREAFLRHGGFDERFAGYGGEDTDFAKSLSTQGVPILWVAGARAYHQFHRHHMPPVHHIGTVLANSALFARKWGYPTMEHWIRAFRLMGLVERRADGLVQVREPDAADLALSEQRDDMPYANSTRVIRLLEARAEAAAKAAPIAAE